LKASCAAERNPSAARRQERTVNEGREYLRKSAPTGPRLIDDANRNTVSTYRRLILDPRISHGAFRYWHYLRDRKNKNGQTWPKVRDIAADLGCKTHSLPGWTKELVLAGYLSVEKVGQKHNHLYTILPGDSHQPVLPKWATRKDSRDAETGDAKQASCRPNGNFVTPKQATPRVAQMGDVSNIQVVNSTSKVSGIPGLKIFQGWQLAKDREQFQKQIREEKDRVKPDQEIIAGLKASLAQINDEIRARGKSGQAVTSANGASPRQDDRNAGTYNANASADGPERKVCHNGWQSSVNQPIVPLSEPVKKPRTLAEMPDEELQAMGKQLRASIQ
jgi:hypothetical protein